MGKGLPYSRSRGLATVVPIIKTKMTVDVIVSAITIANGFGIGSVPIGKFHEGNVLFLGAVGYIRFVGPGAPNLSDTWQASFSVGTLANFSTSTLSNDETNVLVETGVGPAVNGVIEKTRGESGLGSITLDNTENDLDIHLNILVLQVDQVDDTTVEIAVNGEIYMSYIILGDDYM